MADKSYEEGRGPVIPHKVGEFTILGTDQDFPKSSSEALSVRFSEDLEKERRIVRRNDAKRQIDPIRNRFDRMKSYCWSRKIPWDVDWWDYKRLWETAPDVFDPERGEMVPAVEYCDRRGKLRACREKLGQKYVDETNLVLKLGNKIHHRLKKV